MATIFAFLESAVDTPLLGASPTLTYWNKAAPTVPVGVGVAMAELTDSGAGPDLGCYFVDVATVDGLEYVGIVDATAGARAGTRYQPVEFSGEVDARISTDIPAILVDTSATLPGEHAAIQADTDDIQTRIPAALVGGRMDSDVAVIQAGAVDAAAIATDAIDADALAADAVTEIQAGLATSAALADVAADAAELNDTKITTARADNLDEITAVRLGELDAANLPADVDTLIARLTAARAAALDEITAARLAELDPANLPADVDTLLARLTAGRAAALDEVTALRMAELDAANLPADVDSISSRLPATLLGGRMRSHLEALDAGVIDAAAIATDAIDADAIAADALAAIDAALTAAHGAGSWVGISSSLTPTQEAWLRWIWKVLAGDPANLTTHVRASIGSPGSITTPDAEVDVVVTQVDADTATFEQQ